MRVRLQGLLWETITPSAFRLANTGSARDSVWLTFDGATWEMVYFQNGRLPVRRRFESRDAAAGWVADMGRVVA